MMSYTNHERTQLVYYLRIFATVNRTEDIIMYM